MAYGDPLGITLPTVGTTIGPDYATEINAAIQALIDRLETKVTEAGILIGGTLDMNSNAIDEVTSLQVDNLGAPLSGAPNARRLHMSGGEWYMTDNAGNAVQITSGGSLNAASIGGIGGDYGGSDPALVSYVDATGLYLFTTDPGVEARIQTRGIIFERSGGGTAEIQGPASGTLSPIISLPNAYGSSGLNVFTINGTTGVVTFTQTLSDLTVTNLTVGTQLDHGSSNEVFSSERIRTMPPAQGQGPEAGFLATGGPYRSQAADVEFLFPIALRVGDRLKSVNVYVEKQNTSVMSVKVWHVTSGGTTQTQLGSTGTSSAAATGTEEVSVTGLTTVLAEDAFLWIEVEMGSTGGNDIWGAHFAWDRV